MKRGITAPREVLSEFEPRLSGADLLSPRAA